MTIPFSRLETSTPLSRPIIERTLPAIARGLAAGGRSADDLELTFEVIVGVGRDDRELEAARENEIVEPVWPEVLDLER